jgi:hypothetical protein
MESKTCFNIELHFKLPIVITDLVFSFVYYMDVMKVRVSKKVVFTIISTHVSIFDEFIF